MEERFVVNDRLTINTESAGDIEVATPSHEELTHLKELSRDDLLALARDAEIDGRSDVAVPLREKIAQIQALSPIEELLGKTMRSVTRNGNDSVDFEAVTGERWKMYYSPDCCASCSIEDVIGDLEDLVGVPIAMAEESTNSDNPRDAEYADESFTWTFYRFATVKGYVTIRWYGSSNGYYSESASFERVSS